MGCVQGKRSSGKSGEGQRDSPAKRQSEQHDTSRGKAPGFDDWDQAVRTSEQNQKEEPGVSSIRKPNRSSVDLKPRCSSIDSSAIKTERRTITFTDPDVIFSGNALGEDEAGRESAWKNQKKRYSMHADRAAAVEESLAPTTAAKAFHSAKRSIESKRASITGSCGPAAQQLQNARRSLAPSKRPSVAGTGSEIGTAQAKESSEWERDAPSCHPKAATPGENAASEDAERARALLLTEKAGCLSSVPEHLRQPLLMLTVLPPETPVPSPVVVRLWAGLVSERDAIGMLQQLEQAGYLFTARPTDADIWVLVDATVQEHLQILSHDLLPLLHAWLVEMYIGKGSCASEISDDGYYMHNVAYHLSEAGMTDELKQLLSDPFWLEEKLHSYGVASTVVDFRRYLMQKSDPEVRLFLQAFQMSVGSCLTHIDTCVLPAQMIGRLLASKDQHPGIAEWIARVRKAFNQGKSTARRALQATFKGRRYRFLRSTPKQSGGSIDESRVIRRNSGSVASPNRVSIACSDRFSRDSFMSNADGVPVFCLIPMSPTLDQAGCGGRMALRGHSSDMTCMELSPDAMDLVTCSSDGSTCVWDMEIGDCVLLLEGDVPVTCVGLSLDAGLILTGTKQGTIQVWDLDGGVCRKVIRPHRSQVTCLKVAPNGSLVVSGATNGTVGVWALASDSILHHMTGHGAEILAMDANFDVSWTEDHCQTVTASADFCARLWDLRSGSCRGVLKGHAGWVQDVKLTPEGEMALTASNDHTARVWDCTTGECLYVLEGHAGPVNSIVLSGSRALTVSDDCTLRLWDIESGGCARVLAGHSGWLNTAAFTGNTCITGGSDCDVTMWDVETGALTAVLEGHSGEILRSAVSPDGRMAVTMSNDNSARVWDLEAAGVDYVSRSRPPRHTGAITRLATARGATVVSSAEDGRAFFWDAATATCSSSFNAHTAPIKWLACTKDGKEAITVSGDRCICAWDLELCGKDGGGLCQGPSEPRECRPVRCLPSERGSRMKSFACSSSGEVGAVVLFDSSLAVWDLVTGELRSVLQRRGDRDKTFVHSGGINGVLLSDDGLLALTYSKDCTARVWDVEGGRCQMVLEGHDEDIVAAAMSVAASVAVTGSYDGTARLWDLASGSCTSVLSGHETGVHDVVLSQDAEFVVTLAGQQTRVWEVETGTLLHTFASGLEQDSGVLPMAVFDSSSAMILTAIEERLSVWDIRSGQLLYVFVADCAITSAVFVDSGSQRMVVVGDMNGNMHFLPLPDSNGSRHRRQGTTEIQPHTSCLMDEDEPRDMPST